MDVTFIEPFVEDFLEAISMDDSMEAFVEIPEASAKITFTKLSFERLV